MSGAATTGAATTGATTTGARTAGDSVIHDLGYQHYDGPREGDAGARRALFWQGLRAMFGIGRPAKAKAIPVFVAVVTMLPGLGSLVASGASNGQIPVLYGTIIEPQLVLFLLFQAAQGPELLSRDQAHRVLPLFLTRQLTRTQYALTRWLSLWCATLCICLAPMLLLWIGEVGIAKDPGTAFSTVGPKIGPVLLLATLCSWVYAGLGGFFASLSPRRAYATAAVIGAFLVSAAIGAGMRELAGLNYYVSAYVDPMDGLRLVARLLFDEPSRGMELNTPPPLWHFLTLQLAVGGAGIAGIVWRARRMDV